MHRCINTTIAALLMFAAVSGTALAQDLRSPDARDSARQVSGGARVHIVNGRNEMPAYTQFDRRSPDARDGANGAPAERNLSSADARDAARRPVTTYTPGRVVQATQPTSHTGGGFDWGDAGIGAAGMLGLIAIVAGILLVTTQRRRHRGVPFATS